MRTLVILLCLSGTAYASDEEDAKKHFVAGQSALTNGRFAEARDHFQRSVELVPKAATVFNLAVALRGTGQSLQSVRTFERLLAGDYGRLDPRQVKQIEQLSTELESKLAVLNLSVRGASKADIRMDGRQLGEVSATPSRHIVDPGQHIISAFAPLHELTEQKVFLARGSATDLTLELVPLPQAQRATLIVEGSKTDIVRIAGVAEGPAPLERVLEPGRYQVEAQGPDGLRTSEVDLEAGQTLRVRLDQEQGSLVRSPWFWTGIAAIVTASALTAFLVTRDRTEDPVSDPRYGTVSALRFEGL